MKYYNFVPGFPDCETTQQRPIFDIEKSEDEYGFYVLVFTLNK